MEKEIRKILYENLGYGNADKAVNELLVLFGVSQQRELLIAFAKYMEEDKMYARHDEANVDDFLDNHSN